MTYIDPDQVMTAARERAEAAEYSRRQKAANAAKKVGLAIPRDAWIKGTWTRQGHNGYIGYYVPAGVGDWNIVCDDTRWDYAKGYGDESKPIRLMRGRPDGKTGTRVRSLADIGEVMFPASARLAEALPAAPDEDPTFAQLLQAAREEIARYDGIVLPDAPPPIEAVSLRLVGVLAALIALLLTLGLVLAVAV